VKDFDGIDDVVSIPAAGPNQAANYTVASWIFPTRTTADLYDGIFGRSWNSLTGYGTTYYQAGPLNEQIEHFQNGVVRLTSPVGSIPPNRYCFWAVTHDGTNGRLYTARFNDRVLTLEQTTTYGDQTFENLAHSIGSAGASGEFYLGRIGMVSIFNAALSLDQLNRLMILSFAPFHKFGTTVLNGHWPLWESAAATALDHSDRGNNGTVTGTTVAEEPPWMTRYGTRVSIVTPAAAGAAVTQPYRKFYHGVGLGILQGVG